MWETRSDHLEKACSRSGAVTNYRVRLSNSRGGAAAAFNILSGERAESVAWTALPALSALWFSLALSNNLPPGRMKRSTLSDSFKRGKRLSCAVTALFHAINYPILPNHVTKKPRAQRLFTAWLRGRTNNSFLLFVAAVIYLLIFTYSCWLVTIGTLLFSSFL